jgi:hypothetical protein
VKVLHHPVAYLSLKSESKSPEFDTNCRMSFNFKEDLNSAVKFCGSILSTLKLGTGVKELRRYPCSFYL